MPTDDSGWMAGETAPRDGSWIEISGQPFMQFGKERRIINRVRWAETYELTKDCFLASWTSEDGKYAWHCHEWRPINADR